MKKYKQIVFDIDGTLIDTEYAVIHSLQDTIKTMNGKEMNINDLNFVLGITGEDALRQLDIKEINIALSTWDKNMKKYKNTVVVFEEIKELLEYLITKNYELGIVTSKTHKEFEEDFMKFDIAPYFKTIVCADDTKKHKPNAEPLLKYMELTNCTNEEVLYIGDSIYDMKCSQSANICFGLAEWGAKNKIETSMSFAKPSDIKKNTIVDNFPFAEGIKKNSRNFIEVYGYSFSKS